MTRVRQTMVATEITWHKHKVLVTNCYAPPRGDINETLGEIEDVLENFYYEKTIFLGDFNAKSTVWGGQRKGVSRVHYLQKHVRSKRHNLPPYVSVSNGKSWIDVTIISPNLIREIESWSVLDIPTASDHRYISIELFNEEVPKTRREDKVLTALKEDEWIKNMADSEIATISELEAVLDKLYTKIAHLREKYARVVKHNNEQAKPWWNVDLKIERKRTIALRKRYQKSNGPEREVNKKKYYDAHNKYVENIAMAKQASWR